MILTANKKLSETGRKKEIEIQTDTEKNTIYNKPPTQPIHETKEHRLAHSISLAASLRESKHTFDTHTLGQGSREFV